MQDEAAYSRVVDAETVGPADLVVDPPVRFWAHAAQAWQEELHAVRATWRVSGDKADDGQRSGSCWDLFGQGLAACPRKGLCFKAGKPSRHRKPVFVLPC